MTQPSGLIDAIVADAKAFVAIRLDLHAHPELAFQEHRTSDLIARRLAGWGIPVHRGLARTAVIGAIRSGTSDRAIGLRADMDALPMTELNTVAHASVHPGRMHACGHDGHVTMLLAAAKYLATHRNFDGTVYLVFQPAEEAGGGAEVLIREGLLDRFPMQAIFGCHNWPGIPAGEFGIAAGPMLASSNEFRIRVIGKGTHAAMPDGGVDPIPIACQLVQAFQTIVTRNKRPVDTGVISVTLLRAGETLNVIPESCDLAGTVRTFSAEVVDLIEKRMREISHDLCRAFGASCEFELVRRYPATVNPEREADIVRRTLAGIVGEARVRRCEPTMGAEAFSYYLNRIPGAYFFMGADDPAGGCSLHSPTYDFNDEIIPLGATLWVKLSEACLPKE
jgi:amidohydrolase